MYSIVTEAYNYRGKMRVPFHGLSAVFTAVEYGSVVVYS